MLQMLLFCVFKVHVTWSLTKKSLICGLLGSHGFVNFGFYPKLKGHFSDREILPKFVTCRYLEVWEGKKGLICGLFRSHGFVNWAFIAYLKSHFWGMDKFLDKRPFYSEGDFFWDKFKDWEERPNLWPIWFYWTEFLTGLLPS